LKKQNLTAFIQIRVSESEKEFIVHMARKHCRKGISELILRLLHEELSRLSRIDKELDDMRKRLAEF
jgi:hypothetical protein